MNTKQKKQVAAWIGSSALIALMIIYNKEILERWNTIKWPSFALIIIFSAIFKPKEGYKKNPGWINRAVEQYPLPKVWYGIYGIALASFI